MSKLVVAPEVRRPTREERTELLPDEPEMGRWFWYSYETLKARGESDETVAHRELVCVTEMGSNYAEITGINRSEYCNSNDQICRRIHFKDWLDCTERELDPDKVIDDEVQKHQHKVALLMGQVQEITHALGLVNAARALPAATTTTTLARFNAEPVEQYKGALVKAKDHDLPALFEGIAAESRWMGRWMEAKLIPIKAYADGLKPAIAKVNDRIFQVELYAGLTEQVVQIKEGKPASEHTPIHLWQRRCYMDEECLIDYRTGGMTFDSLYAFDRWLCEPAHLERILPKQRSIVAFRIRRHEKEREFDSLRSFMAFAFSDEAQVDKLTYLYLRNGEQVFRLSTAIDFGAQLFPDMEHQNLLTSEQIYARHDGAGSYHRITLGAWEAMRAEEAAAEQRAGVDYARALIAHGHLLAEAVKEWERYEQVELPAYRAAMLDYEPLEAAWKLADVAWWKRHAALKEHTKVPTQFERKTGIQRYWWESLEEFEPRPACPKEPKEPRKPNTCLRRTGNDFDRGGHFWRPYRGIPTRHSEKYKPFSRDNVEYDDIVQSIQQQIDEHNRLVLVLQGLLDRSPVMMPHPASWKLNEQAGFTAALTLVYDEARTLVPGPAPDFATFRDRVNAQIAPGVLCVGQEDFWERREAEKENARTAEGKETHYIRWHPRGNPGPGRFARVAKVRTIGGIKHAVFRWQRRSERRASRYDNRGNKPMIDCSVAVPFTALFNADAYEPGDYKQFYDDPRTRENYLKWAPVLLLSEEWRAGNLYVGAKGEETNCYGVPKPTPLPEPEDESVPFHNANPIVDFNPQLGDAEEE